jgi:hypothetical protein
VAADADGRHVAFAAAGRLWVMDTQAGWRIDLTELGASTADDQTSHGEHRGASFDGSGSRILYFQDTDEGERLVVHHLSTSTRKVLDVGEGLLWRAHFEAGGDHVIAQVVTDDTNRNGRLDWPVPRATEPMKRCLTNPPRFAVWQPPGDVARPRRIPIDASSDDDGTDTIVHLAEVGVERTRDGALHWATPKGRKVLAKDSCEARIVHADVERNRVIVTCKDPRTHRHRLYLQTVDTKRDLELDLVTPSTDIWFRGSPPVVPIHAGKDTALVDMERGRAVKLPEGDRVAAVHGTRALVVRGGALLVRDIDDRETPLEVRMDPYGALLQAGARVAALPWVIDLDGPTVLGRIEGRPIALSSDGHGLMPSNEPDAGEAPIGPFRWVSPTPATTR